jgi:hypothetical protein
VSPRTYPPAPCSGRLSGHRISRRPWNTDRDTKRSLSLRCFADVRRRGVLTLTAPSRNTKGYLRLLEAVVRSNPSGYSVPHNRQPLQPQEPTYLRQWLEKHPRVKQIFIPVGGRAGSTSKKRGGFSVQTRGLMSGKSSSPTRRGDQVGYEGRHKTAQPSGETVVLGRPQKPRQHRRRSFVCRL